jgi:phosphonate transport system substrate-binding protein
MAVMLGSILSACGQNTPTTNPEGTATTTERATRVPTFTPTPEPLGSPNNPFILAAVSETNDPQVQVAAEEVARRISEASGSTVIARVYSNYLVLMKVMEESRAHITWLPPLTYIYASQRGLAEVVLLTNHFGVYLYGSQFMANVASGFTPYHDPISGLNSVEAATALQQFAGRRPCWVEPLSPSGYIVPAGLLAINQVQVLPAVLTQSHTATVRALYVNGICDFGATFSTSGDPRTSTAVLDDLPDAMDRVIILWRSDGVIPNLNLSLLAGMQEQDRQAIITAILDIASTPEGKGLLSYAAGDYQIDDIKPVDNGLYDPLRELVDTLNINLNDMIGK